MYPKALSPLCSASALRQTMRELRRFKRTEVWRNTGVRLANIHTLINESSARHRPQEWPNRQAAVGLTRAGGDGFVNALEVAVVGSGRNDLPTIVRQKRAGHPRIGAATENGEIVAQDVNAGHRGIGRVVVEIEILCAIHPASVVVNGLAGGVVVLVHSVRDVAERHRAQQPVRRGGVVAAEFEAIAIAAVLRIAPVIRAV